jgi:hypothetical protein
MNGGCSIQLFVGLFTEQLRPVGNCYLYHKFPLHYPAQQQVKKT